MAFLLLLHQTATGHSSEHEPNTELRRSEVRSLPLWVNVRLLAEPLLWKLSGRTCFLASSSGWRLPAPLLRVPSPTSPAAWHLPPLSVFSSSNPQLPCPLTRTFGSSGPLGSSAHLKILTLPLQSPSYYEKVTFTSLGDEDGDIIQSLALITLWADLGNWGLFIHKEQAALAPDALPSKACLPPFSLEPMINGVITLY